MKSSFGLAAAVFVAVAGFACMAQAEQTVRLRGTIETVQPAALTVATETAGTVTIGLAPETSIAAASSGRLADIRPGSFVGSAARTLPDGSAEALEVHVFPESMRGAGEGHRPWDRGAGSTMTNGSADLGAAVGTTNRRLLIRYKDGEQTLTVPPATPIVLIAKSDRAALKPGTHVVVSATRADDGTLTAQYVVAGRNGVRPPM